MRGKVIPFVCDAINSNRAFLQLAKKLATLMLFYLKLRQDENGNGINCFLNDKKTLKIFKNITIFNWRVSLSCNQCKPKILSKNKVFLYLFLTEILIFLSSGVNLDSIGGFPD